MHGWTFRSAGAHHWLFDERIDDDSSAVIYDTRDGSEARVVPGPTAIVDEGEEAPELQLLTIDARRHRMTVRNLGWRRDLEVGLPTTAWGDEAVGVVAGDVLIVAVFGRISSGSSLFAVDLRSGKLRWSADVVQLNVEHSEYWNDVTVERRGDEIVLRGVEAGGCYVQAFDLSSGRRRFARTRKNW
jgi:hypothetical protein